MDRIVCETQPVAFQNKVNDLAQKGWKVKQVAVSCSSVVFTGVVVEQKLFVAILSDE